MKKIICIALIAINSILHAQSIMPKLATDISPLLIGEKIPNTTLKSSENKDIILSDLFKKKKTILVFYRGGWCPYCNAHLAALAQAEKQLLDLGYQIVAISPDSPNNLKTTEEKEKLNYLLLSDSKGELLKAMGIVFEAPENYKKILNVHSNGDNKLFLPVPSVFILNGGGEIQFEYIAPDFKHRIAAELLVAVAKTLK